jgi:anti-sigma B factor antagonist
MAGRAAHSHEPFAVEVVRRGRTVTVGAVGELDAATLPELEEVLPEVTAGDRLVLDLRGLTFMDSTGIRLLMSLDLRSRAEGWTLGILKRPGAVARLLDICRIPDRVRTAGHPNELE